MTDPLSTDRLREIVAGTATWQCETGPAGVLWYLRLDTAAKPPYRNQRQVEAILDIADDGTLAGVELIDNMPPAPLALRASKPEVERAKHVGIGMAIAAAICAGAGDDTEAEEILNACGMTTIKELRAGGVDEYDIGKLRSIVKHMRRPVRALTSLEGNRDER